MINSPTTGTFTANAVAGALTVILCWLLSLQQVALPSDVQMAFALVFGWLLSFVIHNSPDVAASKGFGTRATAASLAIVGLLLVLVGCAADGSFASFKKGAPPEKKIDWSVTIKKTCTGLQGMVAVVDGFTKGDPGVLDALGQSTYGNAKKLVADNCTNNPTGDLAGIVANLAVTMVDIGNLVATLEQKPAG